MPWASPSTWTSTCRGSSRYRSSSSRSSPNEAAASRRAPASASGSASADRTTRIPRPPPPALALTSSGNPIPAARATSSSSDAASPWYPGSTGTPLASASALARALSPSARIGVGRRPDPHQAGRLDGLGKRGVLGQEPVARVDRLGAGRRCGPENGVHPEIALGRRAGSQTDRGVGGPDERRPRIRIGVDGDRPDPDARARPHHAYRDLPPVRDQNRRERGPPARGGG